MYKAGSEVEFGSKVKYWDKWKLCSKVKFKTIFKKDELDLKQISG